MRDDLILIALTTATLGALLWLERERLPGMAGRASGSAPAPPNTGARSYYWHLARQAGYQPEQTRLPFLGAKAFGAVFLPLLVAEFTSLSPWLLLPAAAGFLIPDGFLALGRRQRRREIRRSLSFFLDLLLSLLQAGLSLDEAFRRAAEQGLPRRHPLRQEAGLVVAELGIGRDRSAAFAMLAERTGVEELRAVGEALSLGMSRGMSLETILKSQADLGRAQRREEGLRRLDKANAEVLLPLLLCSFPMFVVLVLVPLGMQLYQGLAALGRVLR